MDDFYREVIIYRYQNPQFKGELDPHDITFEDSNPLCGDEIRIDVVLNGDERVTDAGFSGRWCAISQASADLLLESIQWKTIDEIKELAKEDVLDLLGIELGPVRLKCALLPLKVLKAGAYGMTEATEELVE
jgi:nitrogen fixation NifU-like protein